MLHSHHITATEPTIGHAPVSFDNGTPQKHILKEFYFRKARLDDIEQLLDLINGYAASNLLLPRGPQYLYENIRDFILVDRADGSNTEIIACGSLHLLWKSIAEIRALAIQRDYQYLDIGRTLVMNLIEEARLMGVKRLFTFTLSDEFFLKLGFEKRQREDLPSKVWGECSRCPKFFNCDEIGMVLKL